MHIEIDLIRTIPWRLDQSDAYSDKKVVQASECGDGVRHRPRDTGQRTGERADESPDRAVPGNRAIEIGSARTGSIHRGIGMDDCESNFPKGLYPRRGSRRNYFPVFRSRYTSNTP